VLKVLHLIQVVSLSKVRYFDLVEQWKD
jgi:hypothetical protein